MALPCNALRPLIIYAGALKAHKRDHAPQEDIDLFEIGKLLQNAAGNQTVVRVVEYHFGSHPIHQLVEALGGEALEEGVRVPLAANAVDHLAAV